jgi:hypothetical protein
MRSVIQRYRSEELLFQVPQLGLPNPDIFAAGVALLLARRAEALPPEEQDRPRLSRHRRMQAGSTALLVDPRHRYAFLAQAFTTSVYRHVRRKPLPD